MFVRLLIIIFSFLLFACSSHVYRMPATALKKHIVFDLDGTLLYNVSKELKTNKDVFFVNGEYYKLADHSRELIEHLLSRGDVNISFFSGGTKERNDNILKQIKLENGQSFFDIAYKHLDKENLEVNIDFDSRTMPDKFAFRYNKNLLAITDDLENIILIDDGRHWLPKGQEENLFYIFDSQWYYPNYNAAKNALKLDPNKKYMPQTFLDYQLEQSKIFWISSVLEDSLNREDGSFVENINSILKDEDGELISRSSNYFKSYYKTGRLLIMPKQTCQSSFHKLLISY